MKETTGVTHGLTATHKKQLNADLLSFLKAEERIGGRFPSQRQ
jgi:hypothetical protein